MEQFLSLFRQHLSDNGLKLTRQRRLILRIFLSMERRITSEELFNEAARLDPSISLSTVYRTTKLLRDSGLARCVRTQDGASRYEPVAEHSILVICEQCGKRLVILNPYLDAIQREAARQEGFRFHRSRTELYGLCPDCSLDKQPPPDPGPAPASPAPPHPFFVVFY